MRIPDIPKRPTAYASLLKAYGDRLESKPSLAVQYILANDTKLVTSEPAKLPEPDPRFDLLKSHVDAFSQTLLLKAEPPDTHPEVHMRSDGVKQTYHVSNKKSHIDRSLDLIEDALKKDAIPWRHLEYSEAAWNAEFPDGMVNTPIGLVKLGDNQHSKLDKRTRLQYFGLIKPTLERPSYVTSIVEDAEKINQRRSRGENPERASVLRFFRAFTTVDGGLQGFCCATISKDGLEISVSSGPRRMREMARFVKEGAILAVGSTLTSETERLGREDGLAKSVSASDSTGLYMKVNNNLSIWCSESFLKSSVYRASHEPTPAQHKAGNYKKRKVKWRGLTIAIENEVGSVRRGVDRDGHEWQTRMLFPYGYILATTGHDNEHLDCYIGSNLDAPYVYVVHQRKARRWELVGLKITLGD